MIGFFVYKAFFDGWDNLLLLAALNAGFILLIMAFLALPMVATSSPVLTVFFLVLLIYLFHLYSGGVSLYTAEIVKGSAPGLRELPAMIASVWKLSALLGSISVVVFFALLIGFPFYFSIGGVVGLAAVSILFWVSVLWFLLAQWIFPVRALLGGSAREVFRKSALIFFDNSGFSLYVGFYAFLNFLVSIVTVFLMPGFAGILLSHQVALKLRLHKYDFFEENPEADRKKIPWDALLMDEKEKMGTRTFKGMIFPWKE